MISKSKTLDDDSLKKSAEKAEWVLSEMEKTESKRERRFMIEKSRL